MRRLAGLFLLAAIVGCTPAPPAAPAFPESGEQQVQLNVNEDMPQWLLIAHQYGGGSVYWDRGSIVRNAQGQAHVWARVEFAQNQVRESVEGTTIQAVTYRITEVRYLFNCADQSFVITEQRYVDGDGTVAAAIEFPESERGAPVVALPGTAGGLLAPIACQATAQ